MDKLAIASVVLNGFGSMMLIWLPDKQYEYTLDGLWVPHGSPMAELPGSPAEKRRNMCRYRLRKIAFAAAVGCVALGITLQLLDLFRT